MEWYWSLLLLIGGLIFLMALGFPVAIAFIIINIAGTLLFAGGLSGLIQIVENSTDLITTFTLSPVVMFCFMGGLFFHTGLGKRVFDAIDMLMGRFPGRLSFLALGGGTVFATLTGSSMANAAMLGSLLVPEMEKRQYKRHMSIGPILAVGGLAIIIPPSAIAVLLASLASVDVGKVLIAGILPGFVLAALYGVVIAINLLVDPSAAPSYDVPPVPLRTKLRLLLIDTVPMVLIIFMVIGLILLGLATPTEAAAFGVVGVLIAAAAFRMLTLESITLALRDTVMVGGMLFFIVMGSAVFSQLMAYSGASRGFLNWAVAFDMSPTMILLMMILILVVMGTFMDAVSIILITVPIFFPLAAQLGYDLVWFAIVMLLSVEIGLITPPFGLLLFVMMGNAPRGTTFGQIVMAALPYIAMHGVLLFLLILWPQIALLLPSL